MLYRDGLGFLCQRWRLRDAAQYSCSVGLSCTVYRFRIVLLRGPGDAHGVVFQIRALAVWVAALGFFHFRWSTL